MSHWNIFKGGVALSALAVSFATPVAVAQVTSGAVGGIVTSAEGAPVFGATVTATDTTTGLTRSATTGADGTFNIRSLNVSGLYTVSVDAPDYQSAAIEGVGLTLGDTTALNFALNSDAARTLDRIVVSASAANVAPVAVGPSATFSAETLATAPAINRNITDVLRLDPRVYVDESRGDINAVQCGGKNSRYNSLTLDGVRMNDNFGLNSNGYPTERIPFSYDAIEQVAIELAPFDVQYGGFSACNINAVTKSGSNEFHGYAFGDYTNDELRSDTLEGDELTGGSYDEYRYGFGLGGPIVKDKLFFFASYEKLEGVNLFDRGPIGSGAVNEVNITQAEVNEIAAIARDIYGYDPGEIPSSADNGDEKLLLKLDWNISDQHRASFTYNYNDGFNISQSDGDSDELEFSNHLYERGAELNAYVGSLYSDWTDNFSTELRLSYSELDNRQNSIGGTDFGEITIETDDVDVYLGGDDSRQANKLYYETYGLALKGYYTEGVHNLTFGYEREQIDVFNMFVQHVETEIDFDRNPGQPTSMWDPAIENFRLGLADNVNYNNAPSGNPEDAAADWGFASNSVYAQDEVQVTDALSVIAGLRFDWYSTDDAPVTNPTFASDYGFTNGQNLDGKGLLQPRLGFTYDWRPDVALRGGLGLYSGGNPNVWLSNTYSANNVLQFGSDGGAFGLENGMTSLFDIPYGLCEDGVPNGPGYCVPQVMVDAVAAGAGSNFEINYLDPDFDIPSEWKVALGGTWYADLPGMGGEYVFNADLLYTLGQDSAVWIRGDLEETGSTVVDGRTYPTYTSVREPAFVLTNSESDPQSLQLSASVAKEHDFGLDWALGYAYTDAEDVHPMTSSVAFSNYVNRAFGDPQDVSASTSDYNTKHRFTLLANYRKAFFGDNETILSLFGQASSGRPYSVVLSGNPNDITGFTPFLEGNPFLANGFSRNDQEGSWWGKLDIKLEQEFPGFADHKGSVFVIIDNFTNLLNDEWGILREPGFPSVCQIDDFNAGACESRQGDASRYEIRFGARYEF
ncbi:MAG: cell envelope biogenesis protein OmpA [Ponticaulis sp.]|nr:cell envelope biogenesis protein OmpA [Ponticaulis sp.]|tara:strand:- start:4360 stop:7437 length:3078 start_codon:yes stop_codon:yes gene_type:complete